MPVPRIKDLEALTEIYAALADPTRLRILSLLRDGEICVCHIHGSLDVPQPTASRHLAYLRQAGLVEARREGTWMHYRLAELEPVIDAIVRSAAHAMSHVTGADRDRARFERQCGKRLPVISAPRASCC